MLSNIASVKATTLEPCTEPCRAQESRARALRNVLGSAEGKVHSRMVHSPGYPGWEFLREDVTYRLYYIEIDLKPILFVWVGRGIVEVVDSNCKHYHLQTQQSLLEGSGL